MARVHSNMCPPMYVDVFNGRLVSEKRMQEVAAPVSVRIVVGVTLKPSTCVRLLLQFGVPEDILKPADSADILLRMARNIHRASQVCEQLESFVRFNEYDAVFSAETRR